MRCNNLVLDGARRSCGEAPEYFVREWLRQNHPSNYFVVGNGYGQGINVLSWTGRAALDKDWQQYYERMILDSIRFRGERLPRSFTNSVKVVNTYKTLLGIDKKGHNVDTKI